MFACREQISTATTAWRRVSPRGFVPFEGLPTSYIPQDIDYPSLQLTIDRTRASELGLTEKEVVSNVITALTSNQMIAPSIWIDPKSGNSYFLTVMYKEGQVRSIDDLKAIPLHGANISQPTRLDMVATIKQFNAPTELDHTQIRRGGGYLRSPGTRGPGPHRHPNPPHS
jgi:Cu/Ag efflux pump CusA